MRTRHDVALSSLQSVRCERERELWNSGGRGVGASGGRVGVENESDLNPGTCTGDSNCRCYQKENYIRPAHKNCLPFWESMSLTIV